MTILKKISLTILLLFLTTTALTAQRHPEPPKPQPRPQHEKQYSNKRHPRLETIEGTIKVHHREIYIETNRNIYKLIIDNRNPRLNYDRYDFAKLDGKKVELDGYKDNFFREFEVVRLVRIIRHPEPPRPQKRPEPQHRPEPKPQPRPKPQR